MALRWLRHEAGVRYEVRSAGGTLRLYSNGVFHSQYNPAQPVTGSVWDLLLLPAFALPAGRPARVLLLGVGGGAVIRQLNTFLSPDLIVGVELNPVHLEVAHGHFGAAANNVCLLEADARQWLAAYRGPSFDLVIDDLFGHVEGEAVRAIAVDTGWCRELMRVLSPEGALVMNFESERQLRRAALWREPPLRRHWADGQVLTTPHYENAIGAFFRQMPDWGDFERRLKAHPELDARRAHCRLRYHRKPL
ncbi:spermidine synthase [Marinimicrobium locisalis]|uniref:spermidine synthase n=1 Tax=Marinimicrobium locisalis TaxID=546022 RepID=UPI003221989F